MASSCDQSRVDDRTDDDSVVRVASAEGDNKSTDDTDATRRRMAAVERDRASVGAQIAAAQDVMHRLQIRAKELRLERDELLARLPFVGIDLEHASSDSLVDKNMQVRVWHLLNERAIPLIDRRPEPLFLAVDNIRYVLHKHGVECPDWLRAHPTCVAHMRPDRLPIATPTQGI